jgi:hypothetical protein
MSNTETMNYVFDRLTAVRHNLNFYNLSTKALDEAVTALRDLIEGETK